MRNLNKLSLACFAAGLGLVTLTGCEGGELYSVNSPDWVSGRIDEIAAEKEQQGGGEEDIPGLLEDVYTIGATDYSTGWWASFSKDYPIPDGEKWIAQFNLGINPKATNTYKNFALIVTNDTHRGDAGYKEYGAMRFDHQPSGNSEWGDLYFEAHRGDVKSTLTFETDTDPGVDQLGGKVTLTVDRSTPNAFKITMTNGKVTKTMDIKEALPNLNDDASNNTIRAFLVPEGSYINFVGTTIIPIGGLTSREDKQPISMTLKGVPGKVLQGTEFKEAFKNVTAEIQFEQEVSATVGFDDLTLEVIPNMNELGKKTLIAVYTKTYKGEVAEKAIVGSAEFQVVDKMYYTLGETSCTTGWWGAHSTNINVKPGETVVSTFTNYTSGANNWNNWVMVLCKEDNSEYAVVRADNYGWGDGYGTCTGSNTGSSDWATWLAAMNGAKVTTYVTNYGDGTADIKAVMIGNDGVEYVQEYIGITVNDPDDVWFRFTVDGSCLVFDDVLGDENCTSGWWSAHSQNINVPSGLSVSQTFINHTSGNNNWNNWVAVLCGAANNEYAVVRADNYGWGDGYGSCVPSCYIGADWATWLAAMEGAKVTVTVTNHGDGTADIVAVAIGNDGEEYWQKYEGIAVTDPEDVFFRFTVDGSCLVFDAN